MEEVTEPVSPTGQYLNSSVLCISILGVLESEVPIDDSQTMSLLKHVFLPINPRFSSVMIRDKNGERKWKQVEVKLKDHVNIPVFPTNIASYDGYVEEYLSRISMTQLPQDRPLWDIHIIKYPTTNAAGTLIFKLHHALGDGYSLMGALLSCLQRADDPSLPLTFPASSSARTPKPVFSSNIRVSLTGLPSILSSIFYSVSDFGWSLLKSGFVEDDKTPIRSGDEHMKFLPIAISTISVPIDHVKEIKAKLGVTLNDVIAGVVFFGIRLYMQAVDQKSSKSHSTALLLLNTRNFKGYKSVKEMVERTNPNSSWGNQFAFLHLPIPILSDMNHSNPLQFVFEAQRTIQRKKSSLAISLTAMLLDTVKKFRGPESLTITVISYLGTLRIAFGMEKGFVDPHKFKLCLENALEMILKTARESPAKLSNELIR